MNRPAMGNVMRQIAKSTLVVLIFSWLAFLAVHQLVYNGAVPADSAAAWNAALGGTPFFKLVYFDLYQQGLLRLPLIPLIAGAWLVGLVPLAVLGILRPRHYRDSLPKDLQASGWSSPLLSLQITFILVLNMVDMAAGLPLLRAIAGSGEMYRPLPLLLYELAAITIICISFVLGSISSGLKQNLNRRPAIEAGLPLL